VAQLSSQKTFVPRLRSQYVRPFLNWYSVMHQRGHLAQDKVYLYHATPAATPRRPASRRKRCDLLAPPAEPERSRLDATWRPNLWRGFDRPPPTRTKAPSFFEDALSRMVSPRCTALNSFFSAAFSVGTSLWRPPGRHVYDPWAGWQIGTLVVGTSVGREPADSRHGRAHGA
jgi:hypothetical protein